MVPLIRDPYDPLMLAALYNEARKAGEAAIAAIEAVASTMKPLGGQYREMKRQRRRILRQRRRLSMRHLGRVVPKGGSNK